MTLRFMSRSVGKRSRSRIHASIVVLGLLAGFVATNSELGCGGALGGDCVITSDCKNDSLVCVYEYCHTECATTADCATGEFCFKNENEAESPGYCAVPKSCSTTSKCAEGQLCRAGQCLGACDKDTPCLEGQECFGDACYDSCKKDKDCDGSDQKCIDEKFDEGVRGICTTSDPSLPEGPGGSCKINSDCASKNCSDKICVGCESDDDCTLPRRCVNAEPGDSSKGVCESGECLETTLANATQIGTGIYAVSDATPDKDGEILYFVGVSKPGPPAPSYGIFSVSAKGGQVKKLCADLPGSEFHGISIGENDALYVSGVGPDGPGIYSLPTGSTDCVNFNKVQPTQGTPPDGLIDVRGSDISFAADNADDGLSLFRGSIPPTNGDINATPLFALFGSSALWAPIGLAAGPDEEVFTLASPVHYGSAFQLRALREGKLRQIGGDLDIIGAGLALNAKEDTVYVSGYDTFAGHGRFLAITPSTGSCVHQFDADMVTIKDGVTGAGSLRRARNKEKDIFSWSTPDGKLYLFKP